MLFYTYTSIGGRCVNEDSCGVASHEKDVCFVVADGLGGHGGGDVASRCAVDTVCELFLKEGYTDTFFKKAFDSAQKNILEKQKQLGAWNRMKSTLVIVEMDSKFIRFAHIGDSRFYHFKNGKFKARSLDHSVPQLLALSREISDAEIRNHPDRNKLMRVMGAADEYPEFDEGKKIRLVGNNAFLLCTDGFWELIEESDMEKCLQESNTAEEWVQRMCAYIRKNGEGREMDNYTCIAIICKRNWFGAEL